MRAKLARKRKVPGGWHHVERSRDRHSAKLLQDRRTDRWDSSRRRCRPRRERYHYRHAIPSEKRRRTSGQDLLAPSTAVPSVPPTLGGSHMQQTASSAQLPLIEELLEALRTRAAPRWREQALDIFFQEFSEEELDLQVKISENVLSIENKAMVFCKMPRNVRQHWVGKFREMHQLNKTS
uniref:Uncharacterized protein n=1 Tax=Bionectria ochroleuca TaxID=29856 RepID=A0A0B7JN51_BIOOC